MYSFEVSTKYALASHGVGVGCRGFVGQSTVKFLNAIGVAPRIRQVTIRKLQETAETASAWIWNSRDRMATDRTWHDSHAHHHPPGSATAVLLGPPIHTTPTGMGTVEGYGFKLKMVGDEQGLPCMSGIASYGYYLYPIRYVSHQWCMFTICVY